MRVPGLIEFRIQTKAIRSGSGGAGRVRGLFEIGVIPFGGSASRQAASRELFSVAPVKLIFNFLSLIRHGSSYGSLGLYANAVVVLLPSWPGLHGAPLFRGCIILPLETRYFLPYSGAAFPSRFFPLAAPSFPPVRDPLIAPTTHVRSSAARAVTSNCRACRHGELTTEKPITQKLPGSYVAQLCRFHETFSTCVAMPRGSGAARRDATYPGHFNYGK